MGVSGGGQTEADKRMISIWYRLQVAKRIQHKRASKMRRKTTEKKREHNMKIYVKFPELLLQLVQVSDKIEVSKNQGNVQIKDFE